MTTNEPQNPEQDLNKLLRPLSSHDHWHPDFLLNTDKLGNAVEFKLVEMSVLNFASTAVYLSGPKGARLFSNFGRS